VGTNFHLKVFLDVHLSCVTLSPIFEGASVQSPVDPIILNDLFSGILTLVLGVLGVSSKNHWFLSSSLHFLR